MAAALSLRKYLRHGLLLILVLGLIQAPHAAFGEGQPQSIFLPLVSGKPGQTLPDPPAPGQTSQDLIDKAVAEGKLNREKELLYKVYAIFGDPRLPAEYRGDDRWVLDSGVMLHVQNEWNTLSPQTQAILLPYILPPDAPVVAGLTGLGPDDSASLVQSTPNPTWPRISAMGGKALIWYPPTLPNGASLANGMKTALETRIWNKLTGVMEIQPKSDLGSPQQVGPDGALDIYIVTNMPGALGLAVPLQRAEAPTGAGCESWPTYLKIRSDVLGDDLNKGMVQILAHEFMHSLQFSYHTKEACTEYDWLREATATWAMDHTYPNANYEHDYLLDFLDNTHLTLEDLTDTHEYGAYLLPFFLTRQFGGPELVGKMFKNARTMNSLGAVDKAHPEARFEDFWGLFAASNWNRTPFSKMYHDDKITHQLKPEGGDATAVTVSGGETIYQLDAPVEHLSARYYHYKFNDNSASLITFLNGYNGGMELLPWQGSDFAMENDSQVYTFSDLEPEETKGASVIALVKIAGKDWDLQIWSHPGARAFCRDKADERLEELVIVISNHEYKDRTHKLKANDLPPVLFASNVGCASWTGTANYTRVQDGVTETAQASGVVYEDLQEGFYGYNWYGQTYPELQYKLSAASVKWKISGTSIHGCSYNGSGTFEGYHEEYGGPDLYLFPGLVSGPSYRGMVGFGRPAPETEFNVHVTCPDHQYDVMMGVTDFLLTNQEKLNTFSTDGRSMVGSYTFEDYNGVHTFEWNLSAQRE